MNDSLCCEVLGMIKQADTKSGLVQVLGTKGTDRDTWIALMERLPSQKRDMHFHPDYMNVYERTYGHKASLFVWEVGDGFVLFPFIVRPVPHQTETKNDLSSVYGFGGPLSNLQPEQIGDAGLREFWIALSSWIFEQGFVSEFCEISPFFQDQQRKLLSAEIAARYRKDVVVADLTLPEETIWARIEERQRKAAGVARRRGVEISASSLSDEGLADFQARYLKTMENVDASEFWRFPDDYFANCRDCLGTENVFLFNATIEGDIVASFFHVGMYDTLYYHFSCSDPAFRKYNPTSLLMVDSLIWAKAQGYKNFYMGGGRTTGRDSLFTFKNSFCHRTLPLYSYNRILDKAAYDMLCASHGVTAEKAGEFFPAYRMAI